MTNRIRTRATKSAAWAQRYEAVWLLTALVSLWAIGCRNRTSLKPSPSVQTSAGGAGIVAPVEQILLEGSFERVAKAATGTARIMRCGKTYELRLSDVTVQQEGMVRVYLVGHERPSNTHILDETELKYDMAELERVKSEQRIELPSEPDPALRSVVLYYPAFGANLAVAPLRPPMNVKK
jgi:hypothetical protein